MSELLATVDEPFDRTLASGRADIGEVCDPANPFHARLMRNWLNKWLCRIGLPGADEPDDFATSLAAWWHGIEPTLPSPELTLAKLSPSQLEAIAGTFGDLKTRLAFRNRHGVERSMGSTASAKVLYFVRPLSVTAWDDRIAGHVGCDRSSKGYLLHLEKCHEWAQDVVQAAADEGIPEDRIGLEIGRPDSSVAKLLDEYLYHVITRRWQI